REDRQAGPLANDLHERAQFLRAEFGNKRFRRRARNGIGVHFLDLSAATDDLIQTVAVGDLFSGWHHFAADFEKQALDDDGPDPGGLREVVKDALEPNRRPVYQIEIGFRAGIEFAPDFTVVDVHDF